MSLFSVESLFCLSPSYESNQNATTPKYNESQILRGKKSLENYQYNSRISFPFICAKHFARGNQIYWSPTQAVTLGVNRFFMLFFELYLILLCTVGETKICVKLWWNCSTSDKMETNFLKLKMTSLHA